MINEVVSNTVFENRQFVLQEKYVIWYDPNKQMLIASDNYRFRHNLQCAAKKAKIWLNF